MKKKYTVYICRVGYSFGNFEVEAESEEQAKEFATEEAYNHLFSEMSSDYLIDGVYPIEEGK